MRMSRWIDGWMDKQMNRWKERNMDGKKNGYTIIYTYISYVAEN